MEINGANLDFTVWPEPSDFTKGRYRQIENGVEILIREVETKTKDTKTLGLEPISESRK